MHDRPTAFAFAVAPALIYGIVVAYSELGPQKRAEGTLVPYYMFQGGYVSETWARLAKNPEDREATIRTLIEQNGGKLAGLWFSFGADDFVAVAELPDNATAGALGMAVAASGGYHDFRTTPLITAQEAMEMMRRSTQLGFRPAGT